MKVAAVCVTFNRPEPLRLTVEGLLSQTRPPDLIVVVDNGSTPFPEVVGWESIVVHHPTGSNIGYGAALAIGMRVAREACDPDFYFLLDDDSPPLPGALARSLEVAKDATDVGMVGIRARARSPLFRTAPVLVSGAEPPVRSFMMLVDCALVTREAVRRAGVPRSDLFMMCEDIDYSVRIRESGLDLLCRGGESSAPMQMGSASSWRSYYQARNLLRLAIEWRSGWWFAFALRREAAIWFTSLRHGRWHVIGLRGRGLMDALRNRMGVTLDPSNTH